MLKPSFVPLRLYSEYSIESSIIRIKDAVSYAKSQNFPALALSDRMNMFAAVKFYNACRREGIKPLFAIDIVMQARDGEDKSSLLLLAKDYQGYLQLCELLTEAYLQSENTEAASVSWQALTKLTGGHLICLSGAAQGLVGYYLIKGKKDKARALACELNAIFQDNFYLEIQRWVDVSLPGVDESNQRAMQRLQKNIEINLHGSLALAKELDLPLVATHPIEFLNPEDFLAHEVKVCITQGGVLEDPQRPHSFYPGQYFLSADVMEALFADIPSALINAGEIAKRCTVDLKLYDTHLPLFPVPEGETLESYLKDAAQNGLEKRLNFLFPQLAERTEKRSQYEQRLEEELAIINRMGFPGYFLIVADFINWAKNHECPVGPGRGSGAGSLVAYSLGITELDPITYQLFFERFLNPERVSMPDFDVDFCQENRGRVIDYVRSKYGKEAVSQIVTFGTMSSKAVLRDVGRVLGLPYGFCDTLSKLIPLEANRPMALKRAMETEPAIEQLIKKENAELLLTLALKLEDLIRNTGVHAGGVLIAPGKLSNFCPMYMASGPDAVPVSMFDKDDVEAVGLVKFDFLGLRNLTLLHLAEKLVEETEGKKVSVSTLPLDDEKTFKVFQEGNTTAVFQFESSGMKNMLFKARPRQFEELIAFVALYRPGPMDLIPDFIDRMHGAHFTYLHPTLEKILAPTYGIMVYQEQVMQAAQHCAGYTLGGADVLRRAMGKKKPEEMAKQKALFIAGAKTKGIHPKKAEEIFHYMERFAGYGFNKSHAAAYALIAYQTAWLKANHKVVFSAAAMTSEMSNTDQLHTFYEDAHANGIDVLPPSINESVYEFRPVGENQLRYGLGAIKGMGYGVVEVVIEERKKGRYHNLLDFCARVGTQIANKRVIEALIKAGAFDETEKNRALLWENRLLAMQYAEQKENERIQGGLFDLNNEVEEDISLKNVTPWPLEEKLALEKSALGFYLSDHPFRPYDAFWQQIPHQNLADLRPTEEAWIGGFIHKIRLVITKTGRKLYILSIEDLSGGQEIPIGEEIIHTLSSPLREDEAVFCRVSIQENEYSKNGSQLKVVVKELLRQQEIKMRFVCGLDVRLKEESVSLWPKLMVLLTAYRKKGGVPLRFFYENKGLLAIYQPVDNWRIHLSSELDQGLNQLLGENNIRWRYRN